MKTKTPWFLPGGHLKQKNGIHKHHINNHHSRISNNSWDTHKKIKTMPLLPKQQPPYYQPDTMPTPGGETKFIRLNAQYADVLTSGTTETDLYLYTIPANTLIEDGDGLEINFTTILTTNAVDHTIRFYLNGTAEMSNNPQGTGYITVNLKIVKISSTQLLITSQVWGDNQTGQPIDQIANTLNFTTPIPLKFTGQCSGAGVIQTEVMTIDKQNT